MAIKIDQHRRNSSASSTTEGPSTLERLTELLNRDISLFGTSIGLKQKESLYYELGILLSAGLDIQKSLALVEMGQKNK